MSDRIARVVAETPIFDGHNDLAWELRERAGSDLVAFDIGTDLSGTGLHTDIPRLRRGGVGAQFWSVYVPGRLSADSAVTATIEQVDLVRRLADRYPSQLRLALGAADVEQAWVDGRIASLMGAEGGHSIACSLAVLRGLFALGVRYLTLTHFQNTPWADSATDVPRVGGLSAFGHEVVREMNRLGMLVDLSHVAPSTMHAALDTSVAPAFFSHSSARALCDHPRNVPDDVLRRVGDSGGIVMVTFVPGFLTEDCREWMERLFTMEDRLDVELGYATTPQRLALRDAWLSEHPRPPCGVRDVADHIEHVRTVAGAGQVGLGGDFDGTFVTPDGLPDVSGYPELLGELADRGWSDAELAGLTGRNALRVLGETESVAREQSSRREPSVATYEQLDGPGPRRSPAANSPLRRAKLSGRRPSPPAPW